MTDSEKTDQAGCAPGSADALAEGHEMTSSVHAASLMPGDAYSRRVLGERALLLAQEVAVATIPGEAGVDFIRFRVGPNESYGIPCQYIDEFLYVRHLARVPCTPAFIAGVVNHRSDLLTVLDIKHFIHTQDTGVGGEARIIVVHDARMRLGILVDAIEGYDVYHPDELAPPVASDGVASLSHILGIHAGKVVILAMDAFMSDPALTVGEAVTGQ